jgi:hypothetical protein
MFKKQFLYDFFYFIVDKLNLYMRIDYNWREIKSQEGIYQQTPIKNPFRSENIKVCLKGVLFADEIKEISVESNINLKDFKYD